MAFSEHLADRVRQRIPTSEPFFEKKMMGGLIFMVNDKMCIGVDRDRKTDDDRLMLRVGTAVYNDLLNLKGCREMDFTGKAMKGFLFVYPEGFDSEAEMDFWVDKAIAFNHLAEKSPAKKSRKK